MPSLQAMVRKLRLGMGGRRLTLAISSGMFFFVVDQELRSHQTGSWGNPLEKYLLKRDIVFSPGGQQDLEMMNDDE